MQQKRDNPSLRSSRRYDAYLDHPSRQVRDMVEARLAAQIDGPTQWVCVTGTGKYELAPFIPELSRAVGRELARWGIGVIVGAYAGVDNLVAKGFTSQMEFSSIETAKALRQVTSYGVAPDFMVDNVYQVKEMDWIDTVLRMAGGVVCIGGLGFPMVLCKRAALEGIPVIPIPCSGGDAAELREWADLSDPAMLRLSGRRLERWEDCYPIARDVAEILRGVGRNSKKKMKSGDAILTRSRHVKR